jgi:hypothetical protein
MKTILFFILIIGNLAAVFGQNLPSGFKIQSASLKRFGLQGNFVSKGRCENGFFDVGGREQLPDVTKNETYKFNLRPVHLSGLELSSGPLNLNTSLGAVQAQDFNPSLVQYTIHKPLQNAGRDMKSFNDGRYTTFGNAYLVYGLARDLGFIHW